MLNLCRSMRHWVAPKFRPMRLSAAPRAGGGSRSPTACRCCWLLATGRWQQPMLAGEGWPASGVVENTLRSDGRHRRAGDGMARSASAPKPSRWAKMCALRLSRRTLTRPPILRPAEVTKPGHRAITSQVSLRPRSNSASGWQLWASPKWSAATPAPTANQSAFSHRRDRTTGRMAAFVWIE